MAVQPTTSTMALRVATLVVSVWLLMLILIATPTRAEFYVTQSSGYFNASFFSTCSRTCCSMGNLIADSYANATGALIGLAPASLFFAGFNAGIITDTIVNISLANNYQLYTFELTGIALQSVIQQSVSVTDECGLNEGFLQVSGLLFQYDCSQTGSTRVSSLRLWNGTAIKLDSTLYRVATNAFLAGQLQNSNPLGYGASLVANIQNLRNAMVNEQTAMINALIPGVSIAPNTTERITPVNCKFVSNTSWCDGLPEGTRGSDFTYNSVTCATSDCALGRVLAYAIYLNGAVSKYLPAVQFSLVSGTSILGTLAPNTTTMTYGDLRKAFRNEPIGFGTIPGAQIRQILESSVSYVTPANSTVACQLNSRFLQGYNIRFSYDCSLPVGSRVGSIAVGNEQSGNFVPLDETKGRRYSIAAPLNLLRGGNRYKEFRYYVSNLLSSTESTLDAVEFAISSNSGSVLTSIPGTAISVAPTCNTVSCNSTSFAPVGAATSVVPSQALLFGVCLLMLLLSCISSVVLQQ